MDRAKTIKEQCGRAKDTEEAFEVSQFEE